MEARHIAPTPIAAFGGGTLLVSWAVDNTTWSPPDWAITLAFIVGVLLLLISASIWVGNSLKARGRRTVMDLLRELYGWIGQSHPIISLIAVFIVCGSLAGVFWHLLGMSYQKSIEGEAPISETIEVQSSDEPKILSLHDLFIDDCQYTRIHGARAFVSSSEDISYETEHLICFDVASGAFHIRFFFPASDHTLSACYAVPKQLPQIFEHMKAFPEAMTAHRPGEQEIHFSDLTFSGLVYIYHETHLLDEERRLVTETYKSSDLEARFRGHDYMVAKNSPAYEKQ